MKRIIFLCLLISTFLVSIWFRDGYILGTAEDGLIFYNLTNYFHQTQYTWMDYPGLGSPSLTLVAGKPTFFVLSFLQQIGIPGFFIQEVFLFLVLISSAIGIIFLTRDFFPKLPNKFLLLVVLFYWFNPISISGVWNRFLMNYLVFYSMLPIATFLYFRGLKLKKFTWLFIFNVVLLLYSYAFSYVAFVILFWIWLFLITIFYQLVYSSKKLELFTIKYLIYTSIIFMLINSWWIFSLISLKLTGGSTLTTNLFVNQDNLNIFKGLSGKMGNLKDVLSLINASFSAENSLDWMKMYNSFAVITFMYSLVGIILFLIYKLRKQREVLFLGSLFFVIVFLIKGSNQPFGEIFNLIFVKVSFLQVFRNPFEKFGFLLSLISAVLLGAGIYELEANIKSKFKLLIYPFVLTGILLILGFPLYSTLAFTNTFPPTNDPLVGYKVEVPTYYKDLNKYLEKVGGNFRILGIPIKDEGVTYNWTKGFAGVELAVALYDSKGIFHTTSTPFFNKIVPEIEKELLLSPSFTNLANILNVKYYILRDDIDYQLREMTDPKLIEESLIAKEKIGEVKKTAEFGKIKIWQNLNWKDSTFYITKTLKKVDNLDSVENLQLVDVTKGETLIDGDGLVKISNMPHNDFDATASLHYEKVNSTKYSIKIKSVKPTLLVFSELYNDGWHARYKDGQDITVHLRLNNYANGWKVDKVGDVEIVVEYSPQKWMNIGEIITVLTLIVCLLLIYLQKRRLLK